MSNHLPSIVPVRRWLAATLCFLVPAATLFADPQATQTPPPAAQGQAAQTPPPAQAPAAAAPMAPVPVTQSLKVIVLAGKNETNDLQRKIMAPLVVEVLDQNDRPVDGAEVIFRFPINGPSAVFPDGKSSQTVHTNGQGQGAAVNWYANAQTGRFDVHVSASYGNQVGETSFQMINAQTVEHTEVAKKETRRGWFAPTWVKFAVAAGVVAIAAGVVLATRGGGSKATTTTPTITITPGSPSVGGPH